MTTVPTTPRVAAVGRSIAVAFSAAVMAWAAASRGDTASADGLEKIRVESMRPTTVQVAAAIDRDGVDGRVFCGYQGWFAAEGDGAGLGLNHWRMRDRTAPDGSQPSPDRRP